MKINIKKATQLKEKPNQKELGFGQYFTDHMFTMDYTEGSGWHDAQIIPYAPISLDPATMVFHYAQETFEGLKAYRCNEDILLFRPELNARRMRLSNERLCMAQIPEELFIEAVEALVRFEESWIPTEPGTSLYIRPFCFSTEVSVGVHPSKTYKFVIILTPVGAYYPEGVNPIKIFVEDEYVRAVAGGTGFAKCGGNYAASIIAQQKAQKLGYAQVLWLDGIHRKYVEEVGTMNAMFLIEGEIITAPISDGSVLAGITRDSCITILKSWGYTVKEMYLDIEMLMACAKDGRLEEAFGTGTAAVISPIGQLRYKDDVQVIHGFTTGRVTQRLYDELTGIQNGICEDKFDWIKHVA